MVFSLWLRYSGEVSPETHQINIKVLLYHPSPLKGED